MQTREKDFLSLCTNPAHKDIARIVHKHSLTNEVDPPRDPDDHLGLGAPEPGRELGPEVGRPLPVGVLVQWDDLHFVVCGFIKEIKIIFEICKNNKKAI